MILFVCLKPWLHISICLWMLHSYDNVAVIGKFETGSHRNGWQHGSRDGPLGDYVQNDKKIVRIGAKKSGYWQIRDE